MAYITDSIDFSTVNASANTLIATPLPQGAVNYYNPTMVVNTWYRYYDSDSTNVLEAGDWLQIIAGASEQNGIIQKLSNLVIGSVYNITINYNLNVLGTSNLLVYSGTILQSTHILEGKADSPQKISFTANSTEDTIVIDSEYISSSNLLRIDSITITTRPPTIPYMIGFDVKPTSISELGIITFTDGTNNITPNQLQCEAYGYTYNQVSGTCSAFRYNTNLNRSFNNIGNTSKGAWNTTETGTNNNLILGESNTIKSISRNNLIVGTSNQITNEINNTSVVGTLGESTATNSLVLGGNAPADVLGERQSIQLMYGVQTTAGSTVDSYLNNITDGYFVIPDNSIMYFHADVIAVRVGGDATGAGGDYASWVERGVVVNKSGTLTIKRERDSIKSSGVVTDWRPTANVSGTNFRLTVRGETDTIIEWASNITFTEIKTGVTL
jgi:hypothetical protein